MLLLIVMIKIDLILQRLGLIFQNLVPHLKDIVKK